MLGETAVFWLKIGGASMGSTIAVVFKTGGDTNAKLFQRFVLGTIIGFISSPVLIDFLGWTHTPDYWLAAATLSGILGYLFLKLIFRDAAANAVKKRLR